MEERYLALIPDLNWQNEIVELSRSALSGGKAVRPTLLFLTQQNLTGALRKPSTETLDLGLCLEFIHAYSLIHDDLPAMDNDNWRRGKPTMHRLVSEAKAVLVGDALLTGAFEILALSSLDTKKKALALGILARAAGGAGMVGGQWLDVSLQTSPEFLERQEEIHRLKTGALFGASVALGYLARDSYHQEKLPDILEWGINLGFLFQLVDDILDDEIPHEKMEWVQNLVQKMSEDLVLSAREWADLGWVREMLGFFCERKI